MVVGEQVVDTRVVPDVLEEDVQGLEQLDTHVIVPRFLIHELQEEAQHVPLKEEVKHGAVILVSPDQDLGNGSDGLHQQPLVALGDCLVLAQHRVKILELLQAVQVPRPPPQA